MYLTGVSPSKLLDTSAFLAYYNTSTSIGVTE